MGLYNMVNMLHFIYWLLLLSVMFLRSTHCNMNQHLPLLSCQVMSCCVDMLFCLLSVLGTLLLAVIKYFIKSICFGSLVTAGCGRAVISAGA